MSRTDAAPKRRPKHPPVRHLRALYDLVRDYCQRERRDEAIGAPHMVAAWHAICRSVGVSTRQR